MLLELPNDALQIVLGFCDEASLATLSCTDVAISQTVLQLETWKTWSLQKWPACEPVVDVLAKSWRRTYGVRRRLPSSLPSLIDRVHHTTKQARDSACEASGQPMQHGLFSRFLQQVLGVGLVYSGQPQAAAAAREELGLVRAAVAYWMQEQPSVVVGAVRGLARDLAARGPHMLMEVVCSRSALEFMVCGRLASGHSSVLERVKSELMLLDVQIKKALSMAGAPSACRSFPSGVPSNHWWWNTRA